MLQTFHLDARTYNVLRIGRLRIGWYSRPWADLPGILRGSERLQIWSTVPRRC